MHFQSHSFDNVFIRLLSLLTICFTLSSIFGNPATAAPVNDADASVKKLFGRACPTVGAIGNYLTTQGAGDNTIFYTKPATAQQAQALSTTLSPRGTYFGGLVDNNAMLGWLDECGFAPTEQDKLIPRISRSLATVASGTAYILISAGQDPRAGGSIWVKHEFPTLMINGAVTKVVRVDPDDITASSTIWTQGDPTDLPASNA